MRRSHQPSSRKQEQYAGDIAIEQAPPITEGQNDEDRSSPIIVDKALHAGMTKAYAAELAFMEEPVTVMFLPGQDRFSAPFVDAYVNGKGIEVLSHDGHWLEFHQVPVNKEITMKRKYLEVFARAKHTDVKAYHEGGVDEGKEPINQTLRNTNLKFPFTVVHDPAEKRGHEWLQKLVMARG